MHRGWRRWKKNAIETYLTFHVFQMRKFRSGYDKEIHEEKTFKKIHPFCECERKTGFLPNIRIGGNAFFMRNSHPIDSFASCLQWGKNESKQTIKTETDFNAGNVEKKFHLALNEQWTHTHTHIKNQTKRKMKQITLHANASTKKEHKIFNNRIFKLV